MKVAIKIGTRITLFVVIGNIVTNGLDQACRMPILAPLLPTVVTAAEIGIKGIAQHDTEVDGQIVLSPFIGRGNTAGEMLAFKVQGQRN